MAPISETGIASATIRVERSERRKNQTTNEAKSVPSSRCSLSELTISRMNTASLETTLIFKPGGSCGSISVASLCWIRSTMATVLALVTLTMPRPTVSSPLKRASWRLSVRPSVTSATSESLIGAPLRQATTMPERSSRLWNSRSSLTRLSVVFPTTKPPASCTCSLAKASLISCGETDSAAMREGRRLTRMVRSRRPPRRTSPTPSMVSSFFFSTLMAYWFNCCWVRSPCSAIQKIGEALVSTLATIGGSTSFGRRRKT